MKAHEKQQDFVRRHLREKYLLKSIESTQAPAQTDSWYRNGRAKNNEVLAATRTSEFEAW